MTRMLGCLLLLTMGFFSLGCKGEDEPDPNRKVNRPKVPKGADQKNPQK